MEIKLNPRMEYEGDRNDIENLQCVWYYDDVEVYRHPYKWMKIYAQMLNCHFEVRLAILRLAEMLNDPD